MYWIFLVCAVIGGTIFVLQFLLAMLGVGLDGDLPDEIPDDIPDDLPDDLATGGDGASWLFGVLSFKTVIAALTFFGLAGLASQSAGLGDPIAVVIGAVFGLAAMYTVFWTMKMLMKLASDGTIRIQNTLGHTGSVYIPIPPNSSGVGKIQVRVQDRIMEYTAQTSCDVKLKTGTAVRVVEIVSPTIVHVEPLDAVLAAQPEDPAQAAQIS